jgi:uncharacterized protein YndB with AHSA1/START domain
MSAIENQLHIDAPLAQVYAALTTQEGVRGWWNQRCKLAPETGGESTYHFTKGGGDIHMRFRNETVDPAGEVAWRCLENTNTSWVGTTVRWKLATDGQGTRLSFAHAGWPAGAENTDGYRMVVGGWQHFMASLKSWVETGKGQPFE